MAKFFEVSQDLSGREFTVYPGTNPAASNRWLIVGFPVEPSPYGNTLLTTSKIVEARPGRFDTGPTARPNEPRKDRNGNRVFDD